MITALIALSALIIGYFVGFAVCRRYAYDLGSKEMMEHIHNLCKDRMAYLQLRREDGYVVHDGEPLNHEPKGTAINKIHLN